MSTGGNLRAAVGFRPAGCIAAALTAAACTSVNTTESSIQGTRWQVVAINGRPTPGTDAYHVLFDVGRLGASFGCNGIGGTYHVRQEMLVTTELVSTLIGCPEPAATFETQGSAIMRQPMRLEWQSGQRLMLSNSAGTIALERLR